MGRAAAETLAGLMGEFHFVFIDASNVEYTRSARVGTEIVVDSLPTLAPTAIPRAA